MLEIDDSVRKRLLASGALSVNEDGDEIFIGLTVGESQFFCTYEPEPGDGHATAEAELYREIREKHLVAHSAELLGDLPAEGPP